MENKIILLVLSLAAVIALLLPLHTSCFAEDNNNPDTTIDLETSYGHIILSLNSEAAPKTVDNFIAYVNAGFYDGTIFHRVIPGFMIQGGGLTENLKEKRETFAPIQNEAYNGLKNLRGTIAMARTNDPHSASSQFFINTVDNDFLNYTAKTAQGWGYCVFGKVQEGMDVVDKIEKVSTTSYGHYQDVPSIPIKIKKVKVIKN